MTVKSTVRHMLNSRRTRLIRIFDVSQSKMEMWAREQVWSLRSRMKASSLDSRSADSRVRLRSTDLGIFLNPKRRSDRFRPYYRPKSHLEKWVCCMGARRNLPQDWHWEPPYNTRHHSWGARICPWHGRLRPCKGLKKIRNPNHRESHPAHKTFLLFHCTLKPEKRMVKH